MKDFKNIDEFMPASLVKMLNDTSYSFIDENGVESKSIQMSISIIDYVKMKIKYNDVFGQRQVVLNEKGMQGVIESILKGRFINGMLIRYITHVTWDGYTEYDYEVWEGQQRSTSIFEFFNGNIRTANNLQVNLDGKTYHLGGKSFHDIEDEEDLRPIYDRLINYKIMVEMKVMSQRECVDNYVTCNTSGTALCSAEIRHSMCSPHWFEISKYTSLSSNNPYEKSKVIKTKGQDGYRYDDEEQVAKQAQLWYNMCAAEHPCLNIGSKVLYHQYFEVFKNQYIFEDPERQLMYNLLYEGKKIERNVLKYYSAIANYSKTQNITLSIIIGFILRNKTKISILKPKLFINRIMSIHHELLEEYGKTLLPYSNVESINISSNESKKDRTFSESCKSNRHESAEIKYRIELLKNKFDELLEEQKELIGTEHDLILVEKDAKRTFSKNDNEKKYLEQNGICPHCNKHFEFDDMQGDHIIPYSKGGRTSNENHQMLCISCNNIKGSNNDFRISSVEKSA